MTDERLGPHPAVLVTAGLLALGTLIGAAVAGRTGVGRVASPAVASAPASVNTVRLRFEDRPDGSVEITRAETGEMVGELPVAGGNFERGALRALVRQRKLHGVDAAPIFELSEPAAGRLILSDPHTGTRIDLAAFGPTNLASFARLLPQRPGGNPECPDC